MVWEDPLALKTALRDTDSRQCEISLGWAIECEVKSLLGERWEGHVGERM